MTKHQICDYTPSLDIIVPVDLIAMWLQFREQIKIEVNGSTTYGSNTTIISLPLTWLSLTYLL